MVALLFHMFVILACCYYDFSNIKYNSSQLNQANIIQIVQAADKTLKVLIAQVQKAQLVIQIFDKKWNNAGKQQIISTYYLKFLQASWVSSQGPLIIFQTTFNLTKIQQYSKNLQIVNESTLPFVFSNSFTRTIDNETHIIFEQQSSKQLLEYQIIGESLNWLRNISLPISSPQIVLLSQDGQYVCCIKAGILIVCMQTNKSKIIGNYSSLERITNAEILSDNTLLFQEKDKLNILSLPKFNYPKQIFTVSDVKTIRTWFTDDLISLNIAIIEDGQNQGNKLFSVIRIEYQQVIETNSQYFQKQIELENPQIFIANKNYLVGVQNSNILFLIEKKQFSIKQISIILTALLFAILIIIVVLISTRQRYIFLKNIKIYLRSKKIVFIVVAFMISLVNLILMITNLSPVILEQSSKLYSMQFFLLSLFISVNEGKTEFDEVNKHLTFYRVQGISIKSYIFHRIIYILLFTIIMSLANTLAIFILKNQTIAIETFEDVVFCISICLLSLLSNLGFSFLISHLVKNAYILIQILFFYHFLLIFSSLIKQNESLDVYFYQLSGIYLYDQLFDNFFSNFIKSTHNRGYKIKRTFILGAFHIFVYYSIYILMIYLKHRKQNHPQKIQNISARNNTCFQTLLSNNQNPILIVQKVSKKIGGTQIMKQISFSVKKGQIFVIYGQNSTGKTSLVDIILSLQSIQSGSIYLEQKIKIQCCLATNSYFQKLTFVQHIQFLCNIKNIEKSKIPQIVQELTDQFYFQKDANKLASELSGGSLKKLCLALAFIGSPDLLILDQPSLGLDINFKKLFWKMLKGRKNNENLTIILTSANHQQAQYLADSLYSIKDNKISQQQSRIYRISFKLQSYPKFNSLKNQLQKNNQQYQQNNTLNEIFIYADKNQMLESNFLHSLLFEPDFQYEVMSTIIKKEHNQNSFVPLLTLDDETKNRFFKIKSQIWGVISRRIHIFKHYSLMTLFIVSIQIALLILFRDNTDVSISAILILVSFFLYSESRILRNEQLTKRRYKNAIIFGMQKQVYWIVSLIIDIAILFIIEEILYLIYSLFQAYRNEIIESLSICFFYYSILYIGITYLFSQLITNYITYIFFFFYLNGFCFYLADLQFPEILSLFYFPETLKSFFVSTNVSLKLFYQILAWYAIIILRYFILKIIKIKQKIRQVNPQQIVISLDQIQQQRQIQQINYKTNEQQSSSFLVNIKRNSQYPLILDGVSYSYHGSKQVIQNLSLFIEKGMVFCLIGCNGSGKTTFFNLATGLQSFKVGTIKYFGKDIKNISFEERIKVSYCPQFDYLHGDLTVSQNIYYLGKIKGMTNQQIESFLQEYLKYFGIEAYKNSKVLNLSRGVRRKVTIISTFVGNPSLIFLDQPCTGIDGETKSKLWALVSAYCKAKNASAILTTHYLSQIQQYCDKIGILKNGKLIAIGSPRKFIQEYSYGYRFFIKYTNEQDLQYIKRVIQASQSFFKFKQSQQQFEVIYDFQIDKAKVKKILENILFCLLKMKKIKYFQCYSYKLKNAVNFIQSQYRQNSSIILP